MLRELRESDAEFMLEWMHDVSVTQGLKADFSKKTIDDCKEFINKSITQTDLHYAIVNENDEYLGTVSLKNMSDASAEFAITVRKVAMGKGVALDSMRQIIDIGFDELGLDIIYWCVSPKNERAVRFYEKNGFQRDLDCKHLAKDDYSYEEIQEYIWYSVKRNNKERE